MRQLPGSFSAQRVEERLQGFGVAARRGPHQPTRVVIDHARQIPVPLTIRDLIDPDPPQPGQRIRLPRTVGHHPAHHHLHRPPGDPHAPTTTPWARRPHPRRRSLQKHHRGAHVQVPPTTHPTTLVIPQRYAARTANTDPPPAKSRLNPDLFERAHYVSARHSFDVSIAVAVLD